ncbi:MAG: 4-alpha-glucanotransferase, partial [Alphaproteobacteria bacterium]
THYDGREVPRATKERLLAALGVREDRPPEAAGLPDFHADPEARAPMPETLRRAPAWGLFCQLYELRSARSWGIGDFGDLARLATIAGEAGADFLGVNPLHALFLAEPERASPFHPSNRRFLNPLYIAMDDLPARPEAPAEALARLNAAELVDYQEVARLKLAALKGIHARRPFEGARFPEADFTAFLEEHGEALRRHALFEALSLELAAQGHGAGWRGWPESFRSADSPAVAAFAAARSQELHFHLWLQWIAHRQLSSARAAAQEAGMRIGLYLDLAVGEAPDGSATWSAPGLYLEGLVVGAPPDVFSKDGQVWNLAAFNPVALSAEYYAPLRALLAAQFRHAGALRIDHVMALRQLFLIPEGESAANGTHMAYPLAKMVKAVAEEAARHGAVVIGEDLGWVPPGFREAMAAANLLSYRIFYFEQEWGLFRRPATYPEMALACLSTHDLPTLAAWWRGDDIALRARHGLIDPDTAREQTGRRAEERVALVNALIDAGELAPGDAAGSADSLPPQVLPAACRFLARTPALMAAVRLADLIGPEAQTNLPGTDRTYPNWRRRAPVALEDLADHPVFREVTDAMRALRPRR